MFLLFIADVGMFSIRYKWEKGPLGLVDSNLPTQSYKFPFLFPVLLCFTALEYEYNQLSSTPANEVFHHILWRGCKVVSLGGNRFN